LEWEDEGNSISSADLDFNGRFAVPHGSTAVKTENQELNTKQVAIYNSECDHTQVDQGHMGQGKKPPLCHSSC
jgi:hypothetical protein